MTFKRLRLYRFTVTLFMALTLTLGFVFDTTKVFAIPDVDFYSGNDILFYDPDSGACGSSGLRGGSVKEKIWNYLVDNGLSAEQAAGIMGNMQAESGFVPTRRQGTGDLWNSNYTNNAWGLAQWDGGRRFSSPHGGILGKLRQKKPELEKYTAVKYDTTRNPDTKIPAEDLDAILLFELEYLREESNNRNVTERGYGVAKNEWETLKLQKSVDDATVFWHNNFEVSADSASRVLETRGGFAHDAFDKFSGNKGTEGGTGGGNCASGTLEATVLKYAWPKNRGNDTTRTSDYATAVDKAQKEGRYVGDCQGVDCGGFVTLLVTDSGFDPNYNSKGKGGNTTAQAQWAQKNWETLGSGSSINTADLKAGDVAISNGHTFIYVGKIEGFDSKIASASQCERAPMAGTESLTDGSFTWYRKK